MAEVVRSFRCFPYTVADGPHNMATDEVLLDSAAEAHVACLRFYGWSEATVSLGYFQPAAVRQQHASLAQLTWVRRPSGGKTLVHHHELTYALALPRGFRVDWMPRMHRDIILPALARLGLGGRIHVVDRASAARDTALCFQQLTPGDLTCAGCKVVGSAQRKHRQCLLQHGAILLRQSEHTPELPGVKELSSVDLVPAAVENAVLLEFQRETTWVPDKGEWTTVEKGAIEALATNKFGVAAWNEKR